MALQEHRLDTVRVNDYIISAIPVTLIDVVWPQVEPLLMMPIDVSHGECDIEVIYQQLKNGNILLLTVSDGPDIIAVMTLEVRVFDSGLRTLYVPLIGGTDMEKWLSRAMSIVKAIAKDFDCTELRGVAVRKGWLRVLKNAGWEEVSTTVKCHIGGE